jgi:hypothetical protein
VAGGEQMARIHAHRQPLGAAHALVDCREMLEPVAEIRPLPRRRLQRDPHPAARCLPKHFVKTAGHLLQSRRLTHPHVRTGMHHDKRHAERVSPFDLVNQRPNGPS